MFVGSPNEAGVLQWALVVANLVGTDPVSGHIFTYLFGTKDSQELCSASRPCTNGGIGVCILGLDKVSLIPLTI